MCALLPTYLSLNFLAFTGSSSHMQIIVFLSALFVVFDYDAISKKELATETCQGTVSLVAASNWTSSTWDQGLASAQPDSHQPPFARPNLFKVGPESNLQDVDTTMEMRTLQEDDQRQRSSLSFLRSTLDSVCRRTIVLSGSMGLEQQQHPTLQQCQPAENQKPIPIQACPAQGEWQEGQGVEQTGFERRWKRQGQCQAWWQTCRWIRRLCTTVSFCNLPVLAVPYTLDSGCSSSPDWRFSTLALGQWEHPIQRRQQRAGRCFGQSVSRQRADAGRHPRASGQGESANLSLNNERFAYRDQQFRKSQKAPTRGVRGQACPQASLDAAFGRLHRIVAEAIGRVQPTTEFVSRARKQSCSRYSSGQYGHSELESTGSWKWNHLAASSGTLATCQSRFDTSQGQRDHRATEASTTMFGRMCCSDRCQAFEREGCRRGVGFRRRRERQEATTLARTHLMIDGRVSPCLQLSEGHYGRKIAFNPLVEAYGSGNHCCAASWGFDVCRTFDYNDYRFHHAVGVPVDFNFDAYAFVLCKHKRTANCLRYQVLVDQSLHFSPTIPLRSRLLDERNSVSVSAGSDEYVHEEGPDRLGDPEDEQLVIIDGWQDLLEMLHQQTPSPGSLIHLEMYGLHITHHSIRITDCESTIAAIREAVQQSWSDAMPPRSVAYIHLVRPQEQRHARAVVLQLIVEIVPFGVDIPPNDVPILRRIRWHSDHSMTLETAYMRDHQTGYELLFDAHLDEWCHPRHGVQCNVHIESQMALMAHRHHLLPGSLIEIFIHDDDRPEPSTSSQHVDPPSGLPRPVTDGFDVLREWLVERPHPQVSLVMYGLLASSLGTRYTTSQAVLQAWHDYTQPDTFTLSIVKPQDDRQPNHLHLIVEIMNPPQARPAGYLPVLQRISWRNIWQGDTSAAVYRWPGQNMREMLAACNLAEWCGPSTRAICRIQVERRFIGITEPIELQAGSLVEVFVSLQHADDDGFSLLQTGTPISAAHWTTIGHDEPSNVSCT